MCPVPSAPESDHLSYPKQITVLFMEVVSNLILSVNLDQPREYFESSLIANIVLEPYTQDTILLTHLLTYILPLRTWGLGLLVAHLYSIQRTLGSISSNIIK